MSVAGIINHKARKGDTRRSSVEHAEAHNFKPLNVLQAKAAWVEAILKYFRGKKI